MIKRTYSLDYGIEPLLKDKGFFFMRAELLWQNIFAGVEKIIITFEFFLLKIVTKFQKIS